MRTFIAIELPQEIKDRLAELEALLKRSGADVKWVASKNIHLTLKFLGEIDEAKSVEICGVMEKIAKGLKPFQIDLSACGAFPGIRSPRVIWAGISSGDKETAMLAEELEERLAELGIPKEERAFSSHITIGRTRSPLNKDKLSEALKETENYFGGKNIGFTVKKITLFKSTLTPAGPLYEPLKEVDISAA